MRTRSATQRTGFGRANTKPIYKVELDLGPSVRARVTDYTVSGWSITLRISTASLYSDVTFTAGGGGGTGFVSATNNRTAARNFAAAVNSAAESVDIFAQVFGADVELTSRNQDVISIEVLSFTADAVDVFTSLAKTVKFVSGSRPYKNQGEPYDVYPCMISNVSASGAQIDVLTFKRTISACEITFRDPNRKGLIRQALKRAHPKGRALRVYWGFHDWNEEDFEERGTFVVDDVRPEAGAMVFACGDEFLNVLDNKVTVRTVGAHILAVMEHVLLQAGVPSFRIDSDSFDETNPIHADWSHEATSRNDIYPTVKGPGLISPDWTIGVIDEGVPAKEILDQLCEMARGTIIITAAGLYRFVRFDRDDEPVRHLTRDDIADFEVVSTGENHFNTVEIKTSKSGGPIFRLQDLAALFRAGISGHSQAFVKTITSDWVGNAAYLGPAEGHVLGTPYTEDVLPDADPSPTQRMQTYGAVQFSGTRPETTVAFHSTTYPTQRSSDALSDADGRYAYLMLVDLSTWQTEIVRARAYEPYDEFDEQDSYFGIEEVTPYPGSNWNSLGGVLGDIDLDEWPEDPRSLDDYFMRPAIASPRRLVDRGFWDIDQRGLFGTTRRAWRFYGSSDPTNLAYYPGVSPFVRILDVTPCVRVAQDFLLQGSNGIPIVRLRVNARHSDLEAGDKMTFEHPLYVEQGKDGADASLEWRIIQETSGLLSDTPTTVYTLARVRDAEREYEVSEGHLPWRPSRPRFDASDRWGATTSPPVGGTGTSGSGLTPVSTGGGTGVAIFPPDDDAPVFTLDTSPGEVGFSWGSDTTATSFDFNVGDDIDDVFVIRQGTNYILRIDSLDDLERLTWGNEGSITYAHTWWLPTIIDPTFDYANAPAQWRTSSLLFQYFWDDPTFVDPFVGVGGDGVDIQIGWDGGIFSATDGSYWYSAADEANGGFTIAAESGSSVKQIFVKQRSASNAAGRSLIVYPGQGSGSGGGGNLHLRGARNGAGAASGALNLGDTWTTALNFGNATDNPVSSFLGSGDVRFASQARFAALGSDPAAVSGYAFLYSRTDSGTAHLFARDGGGTIHQLTPPATGSIVEDLQDAYDGGSVIALVDNTVDAILIENATGGADLWAIDTTNSAETVKIAHGVSSARVAIGDIGARPDAKLHVFGSSAGTVDGYTGAQVVIEDENTAYLSLLSADDGYSAIWFGSPADNGAGGVFYDPALGTLTFAGGGIASANVNAGGIALGEARPDISLAPLHIENDASGASPAGGTQILIEGSTPGILMSFLSAAVQGFYFGDAADNDRFRVTYDHSIDVFAMNLAGTNLFTLTGSEMHLLPSSGVMVGSTAAPDSLFHVRTGDSGASALSGTTVTVEDDALAILSFLTGNTGAAGLIWGDAANNQIAQFGYNHSTDEMYLYAGGTASGNNIQRWSSSQSFFCDGAEGAPAVSFINSGDGGLFLTGGHADIGMSTAGVLRQLWNANAIKFSTNGTSEARSAQLAVPRIAKTNDTSTTSLWELSVPNNSSVAGIGIIEGMASGGTDGRQYWFTFGGTYDGSQFQGEVSNLNALGTGLTAAASLDFVDASALFRIRVNGLSLITVGWAATILYQVSTT